MSQIATDAIQDAISKTGKTHPAPRKSGTDPCPVQRIAPPTTKAGDSTTPRAGSAAISQQPIRAAEVMER